MTIGDWIGAIVTYLMLAGMVGVLTLPVLDFYKVRRNLILTDPELVAAMVAVGLAWPITGPVLLAGFLIVIGRATGIGAARLWRRWRAHRAEAKARRDYERDLGTGTGPHPLPRARAAKSRRAP